MVLRPSSSPFDFRLKELWRCRDLISLFIWRDFVALYKQTILGPLWHLVQPLLTTLTFTLIFGRVARLSTDGQDPFLFYMVGNVVWAYFSGTLTKTATTFVANAHLYGKVYFHRLAIPVSVAFSNLISMGIQFVMLVAFMVAYRLKGSPVQPTVWIWFFPILMAMLGGFSLGFGIVISALTTRYRDLVHVVGFGVQLWMYATPVIYPLSAVPPKLQWIVLINPLTPVMEACRYGLLGAGTVNLGHLAYSLSAMGLLLLVGLTLFTRVERTFMDTV